MAAARVNRMAVACADRIGTERGQEWTGGTTIIGVDGWVAAEARAPGLVIADVDLEVALDKRSPSTPTLRRPPARPLHGRH